MAVEHYIAGDWGTSNLRVYLCEFKTESQTSRVLEVKSGLGVGAISRSAHADFESEFFTLADDWLKRFSIQKIILSGMVGSNIGWHMAQYSKCPANATTISQSIVQFRSREQEIHIVSGLSCNNPLGQFDVMRGEELQLLGWLLKHDAVKGSRLFALPGTHNKWVLVRDDQILNFTTSFTGELFQLLCEHSVLLTKGETSHSVDQHIFDEGVELSFHDANADVMQTLFSTRSRQISGELNANNAQDYLSGLIIGCDVRGALASFESMAKQTGEPISEIVLIGEASLCNQYSRVLQARTSTPCSHSLPTEIASHGFRAIYQELIARKKVKQT
ncbi:MAG TPA: 2-keto-3-deoxy-galactonokinase [Gammaproteobacteria bacterium]|nr:2-dehydro-3-deoxygalactonokinase [bacterium]HAU68660.1 2-keto-3-deoxy-galactonokinase [Gammaproteobacteria bacterium]